MKGFTDGAVRIIQMLEHTFQNSNEATDSGMLKDAEVVPRRAEDIH